MLFLFLLFGYIYHPDDKRIQSSDDKTIQSPDDKRIQSPDDKTIQSPVDEISGKGSPMLGVA